jgi:histone deacetylase complex regulatory component SIN3
MEGRRWKTRCAAMAEKTNSITDTLASTNPDLYPNVTKCLHVLLAMPVSTASAERSFSSMRRLKTYLRSTMTTERLSGLGLLNIHREKEINSENVVDIFARRKDRRLALLFHV